MISRNQPLFCFYSKRTEDYAGQSVNGVDWYVEVDCDFMIALLRVLPETVDSTGKTFFRDGTGPVDAAETWLGEPAKDIGTTVFPAFGKTDVEVFGTNLLEVMQFVMNHTTFDPSVEMDRALLRPMNRWVWYREKVYDPTEVPRIDLPYFSEVAQQLVDEAKMKQKDPQTQERMVFQRYGSKGKIDLETEYVQSITSSSWFTLR